MTDLWRRCPCGTVLSRTNPDDLCSACQRRASTARVTAPLLPLDFWTSPRMRDALRTRDIGKVIYAYRTHPHHGKEIPQQTIAEWANVSQAQVSRTEYGKPIRNLDKLIHWANSLHIPRQLLWFAMEEPPDGGNKAAPLDEDEVITTLRREFMTLSGSAVMASTQLLRKVETGADLMQMNLDRGTVSAATVAQLEDAATYLGVVVVQVPPMSVLESAIENHQTVLSLIGDRQPTALQARLVRVAAQLNTVVGEILFNMGNFEKAQKWYRTAANAAHDIGDRYLADIALAGQAYLPTYSDDPSGVLKLLEPRLDGCAAPSPAISWLWGLRARAHATLGEIGQFDRAIAAARESLSSSSDDLVKPGIFSFVPEKLAFYEANGAVLLDKPTRAIEAANSALSMYDMTETTEPALAQLEKASALFQMDEIAEACHIATEAISSPSTYQSITVRRRAKRFDTLLDGIKSREVDDWRDTRRTLHS
jgi:tetratricopeptide (TPR) repeat protein